ncbi:hypothetical protein TWF788_003713 [Orbilia oligospora]|uniref:Uncharacterized protein n=1 Tax=Orbilia oligospora TaxID=2813651 RepID=A0A7C8KBV9_ORBOL|nr:hypothetical protein TWF788_003713 [Orbilia oligospora]
MHRGHDQAREPWCDLSTQDTLHPFQTPNRSPGLYFTITLYFITPLSNAILFFASDDSLRDSGSSRASISSASSISADDEQELTQGLNNLTLANTGTPALECKPHGSKKDVEEKSTANEDPSNSPTPSALPKNGPDKTSKADPDNDRAEILEGLLGKKSYDSEVARTAGNETLTCFPIMSGLKPSTKFTPSPQVTIDVSAWQAGVQVKTHGYNHGKQANSFNGPSGNGGAGVPPIYPNHVKPPSEWGNRNRQGDDGPDESSWGRENRALRAKKRIACPAAKGDPFNNRACLGVSFPNLAKTRQHLSCAAHFAVEKTPLLPDEIRDPNGWDEIMAYIYPEKVTPSSDEDFHPTMDIIEKWGTGPGRPDFRSTIIRLLKRAIYEPGYGANVINELEAIDPSSKEEHDTNQPSSSFYSSPSDISSFQSGVGTANSSLFVPHTGYHLNSPVNSEPSQTFASTSMNTPISGSSGSTSAVLPGYNSGALPGTASFGNHNFSGFSGQSNLMDTNRCSPDVPDLHNQVDNEMRMSPVGGPSPDRQLQMYFRSSSTGSPHLQNDFPLGSDVTYVEYYLKSVDPNFSFETYPLNIVNDPTRPIRIGSLDDLRAIYPEFSKFFPRQNMVFQLL